MTLEMRTLFAVYLALTYARLIGAHQLSSSTTSPFSLTAQISEIVPCCAQTCFISFLESNFLPSACSTTPTLNCLCTHNSTSGFTVGEGALQCIAGYTDAGLCTGEDAEDLVWIKAYNMCSTRIGALPNTHPTITATRASAKSSMSAIISTESVRDPSNTQAPSGTSSSSWSLGTTKSSTTAYTTPIHTGIVTAASTSPHPMTSSLLFSSTKVIPSTTTGSTTTASTSQLAESAISPSPTSTEILLEIPSKLASPSTTAGIAMGCILGGFAVVGLLLFCCLRRRRKRQRALNRDSFLLPFQMETGHSKTAEGFRGPTEAWIVKAAPPIRERSPQSNEPSFKIRHLDNSPQTLALAVTPQFKFRPDRELDHSRRQSALLPPKPEMEKFKNPRQTPPKDGSQTRFQDVRRTAALDSARDKHMSIETEFEDDSPPEQEDPFMVRPPPALIVPQETNCQNQNENWHNLVDSSLAVAPLSFSQKGKQRNYSRRISQPRQTSRPQPALSIHAHDNQDFLPRSFSNQNKRHIYQDPNYPQLHDENQPSIYKAYRPPQQAKRQSENSLTSIESGASPTHCKWISNGFPPRTSSLSPVSELPSQRPGWRPALSVFKQPTRDHAPAPPQPIFTTFTSVSRPVEATFWTPSPIQQTQMSPTHGRKSSQVDIDNQQKRRLSRATKTPQSQPDRNNQVPEITPIEPELPGPQRANSSKPRAIAHQPSVMARPRPIPSGTLHDQHLEFQRQQQMHTNKEGSKNWQTINESGTESSESSRNNSLLDRRGKDLAPVVVRGEQGKLDGQKSIRNVGGEKFKISSSGSAGLDGGPLSPGARNMTPRKIGDALFLGVN